jgi:cell division protein ZapE
MTPTAIYHQHIQQQFQSNPLQAEVVAQFQQIYDELTAPKKLFKKSYIQGLYLWGGVGIGKTWLMDIFYQSLPIAKLRMHFHGFMQHIHQELKTLQGQADPLKKVAKRLAKQTRIICLDEFLVFDITDAMLLANLLDALFKENITLVTTSNVAPTGLYHNGLQRNNFLPAIALLQKHLAVFHLQSMTDYRLRDLTATGTYFFPLNKDADLFMQQHFQRLTYGNLLEKNGIEIFNRKIKTLGVASDVIWFDFHELCHVPRSQMDYLEIAKSYSTILVSNVPKIEAHQDNIARYLINLIDVFYDSGVKLILSAAVAIDDLYPTGRLSFEFERTHSRLLEMQSRAYLHKQHLLEANKAKNPNVV